VFLTWLYITSYVLLMGGELNSELERMQAEKDPAAAAKAGPQPGQAAGETPGTTATAPASPRPVLATAREGEASGGKAKLALVLGAALGLKLWRRRKQRDDGRIYYEYPEEGASLRLKV
jgi:hypothetical protein